MPEKTNATQFDLYNEWAEDRIPVTLTLLGNIRLSEALIICVADDYLILRTKVETVAIPFAAVLYVSFKR